MQKALMWLNPYGCPSVRHKLKKGVKTEKMHFVFDFDFFVYGYWVFKKNYSSIKLKIKQKGLCNLHAFYYKLVYKLHQPLHP
jgi:hypothetical protein